jgi:hypothetical protein
MDILFQETDGLFGFHEVINPLGLKLSMGMKSIL